MAKAGRNPLLHYAQVGRHEGRLICAVADPAEVEAIRSSGLFDLDWYRRTQALKLSEQADAAQHYLKHGAHAGLNPGPLFDGAWYLAQNPDVTASGENPLLHYIRAGRAQDRLACTIADPAEIEAIRSSGLFDADWYRRTQAPELSEQAEPVRHYLQYGARGEVNPGPLFDGTWYLAQNPDVAATGENPLLHYIRAGRAQDRLACAVANPAEVEAICSSGLFDVGWYRHTQAPDLPDSADPVRHYLQDGARADLNPGPFFDGSWYLAQNPDVAAAGRNPLLHYAQVGRHEGRLASAIADPAEVEAICSSGLFDADWYRRTQAPDLPDSADPVRHYLQDGARAGLNPGPFFDGSWYLAQNRDVAAATKNPLLHYLVAGRAQDRLACAVVDPAEVEAIRSSGLFDADWYRRTQALELSKQAEPVRHYLQHGARAGLNPGPLFDGAYYLAQHRDVLAAEANPLLHYVQAGHHENRRTRNVGAHSADPDRLLLAVSLPNKPPTIRQIAVVVHAFYPDLFDEVCLLLRNIPIWVNLMVGVPDLAAKQAVEQAVERHGLAAHLICRVTPNRGRNFGTFLAAFAREILLHDLVLHLHTKRSLYTGSEQEGWRNTLYNGLLGSAPLVRLIIGLFEEDRNLGLYYPATYADMPYWAHHWLSNAHQGGALLHRLGVTEYPRFGYFDYPVGGMFWARVDALRPLLEANLTHADFPDEMGQTDGTLAHAVERVVGILPRALGYGFIEYEHATGKFRGNWGMRNIGQYAHASLSSFEAIAAEVDLVSFDIFDTLVVRPALTPDAVMRYTGHKIALAHPALTDFFERRK